MFFLFFFPIPVFFFVKRICTFLGCRIRQDRHIVSVESAWAGLVCQSNKSLSRRRTGAAQDPIDKFNQMLLSRRFCRSFCIHMKSRNFKFGCSIFRSITHDRAHLILSSQQRLELLDIPTSIGPGLAGWSYRTALTV